MNYSDNKRLAHVTEGEVVIPREVAALRPELVAHIGQQLRQMGGDPQRLQVGKGYVNPKTGVEEFATREEVTAAYRQILGRDPDANGLNYWMNPSNGFSLGNFAIAAAPDLRASANKYQTDATRYQTDASKYQSEANKYLSDLQALQKQYGTLNTDYGNIKNQYGTLNTNFGNLQNQFGGLQNEYSGLQSKYGDLEGQFNKVQQDLAQRQLEYGSLQDQYSMLNKEYAKVQRDANGNIVGGNMVDDGSTFNFGDASTGGTGTTGVVYGPDGTPFSSVAAAVAAGVTNYSFSKPATAAAPNIGSTDATSTVPSPTAPAPTAFNFGGGGLISNANQQLFRQGVGARVNPFAIR